jgi:TolB-like protein
VNLLAELRRRNVFRLALAYIVTAWVVVESASLLLSIFKAPDWVAQAIVVLLAAGFPVALVFAWMFEITPDGIKHDSDVRPGSTEALASGRYLVLITIVMTMLAAGLFVVDRFLLESRHMPGHVAGDGSNPVVAVLPFEIVGSDDAAVLADGLHHDLLTRLSRLRAFSVISRTSMLDYGDTTKNIRQIGEELGAGFILEGGVQLVGDRVRVNAQLIDASVDKHLWADTYDREMTANDLFAIQSNLATVIAEQLELTLSPSDREQTAAIPTENTEAYAAYLRGLATQDNPDLGQERLALAHAEIRKAIELDPGFTAALAQLVRYSGFGLMLWEKEDAMLAELTEALGQLRLIAPASYDAGIAEVYFLYYVLNDFDKVLPAIAELENRGALGPNAHYMRGKALRRAGRIEEAYQAYLAAARLNPRALGVIGDLLGTSILLGDCERAGLHASAALALAPKDVVARTLAADYELQCTGNAERADELLRGYEFTSDGALWAAIKVAAIARDWQRAIELLEQGELSHDWWGDRVQEQLVMALLLRKRGRDAESNALLDVIESTISTNEPPVNSLYRENAYKGIRMRYAALRGDADESRRWSDELSRGMQGANTLDPITRANSYEFFAFEFADAGQTDRAIDALELLFADPSFITFRFVDAHPAFDDLRDNPRYIELRRRYGGKEE